MDDLLGPIHVNWCLGRGVLHIFPEVIHLFEGCRSHMDGFFTVYLLHVRASPCSVKSVEKIQFSLVLISCHPEIFYSSWLSWYLLLRIACLHVSFTAYENVYKLSKMHCLLVCFSTFQPSEVSEKQRSNNQTYIHLYTDLIIHKYICDRSLSGDPFHIVNPFLNAQGLFKCDSTHIPN